MIKSGMIKQTLKSKSRGLKGAAALMLASVFTAGVMLSGVAQADRFEAQINQLRAENNSLSSERQELRVEADSLEATIATLRAQISELERQITSNRAKAVRLEKKIASTEAELDKQRGVLGENIKAMYLEDNMSTIERLASSKDLSEYVDREQYRNSVKDKIRQAMARIETLKAELDREKRSLDKVIADQKAMQGDLAKQRAEQNRLLALNQQQRSQLDGEIRTNSTKIAQLRQQQAAENRRLMGSGVRHSSDGTGYPWANVQPFPNSYSDPWGMYKRQCVSYTAWRVANSGRHMPYWGGRGNAKLWDDNARAAGIPVSRNPRVGDVAVSNRGYYGHVMYVEAVHGDGTISISQYNAGWDGRYSEARIPIGDLVFIHF
jgi:peptidoglycan DL-endopeptidase CwlO